MTRPSEDRIQEIIECSNEKYLQKASLDIAKELHRQHKSENIELNKGIVFIAFGLRYLVMAINACLSIKTYCNISVSILTNVQGIDVKKTCAQFKVDGMMSIDVNTNLNRLFKLSLNLWTPYLKTAYFDCDTYLIKNIDSIFDYLEHAPLALSIRPFGLSARQLAVPQELLRDEKTRVRNLYPGGLSFNSGIILCSKEKDADVFFILWRKLYKKQLVNFGMTRDQPPLFASYSLHSGDIAFLPLQWNFRDAFKMVKKYNIHHYQPNTLSRNPISRLKLGWRLILTTIRMKLKQGKNSSSKKDGFLRCFIELFERTLLPFRYTNFYKKHFKPSEKKK